MNVEQSVYLSLSWETQVFEKTGPSATLFTTNPIWPNLGSNEGRRGGKPGTNGACFVDRHW
jgi:hypothetical protein